MTNYSDKKNIYIRLKDDDRADQPRHFLYCAWEEGFLAGEKARFTEQEKRVFENVFRTMRDVPFGKDFPAFCSLLFKITGKSLTNIDAKESNQ